ncbi:PREDICTED: 39S ribosomal protein L47, mitochondrial-like [Amphimedon queenslandica]|uniref:Large ribosomal subunit protein uL29m n=1 Tax=Amphimedon queenslandica TaxID=400682 RepID=A0A1X7UQR6_AMPQE|nr:PREDICTED: 39S ribosomal protein L47, mitochondrial-like [Amphimedon queenslandica]|eukprot:XP_011404309.2 PREDICTED: 39S ribosomal protein L47, mitochondrial-like [Amphimedon queenslandica]
MLLCRVLTHSPVSSIAPSCSALLLSPLLGVTTLINVRGRGFHTSSHVMGLEEFFPKTKNIIEESERTGRPWKARELRQKSNEDLHKLWYVLLKERNMLLTLRHEANRNLFIMPGPERLKKVKYSMDVLKHVIKERGQAVREARIMLKKKNKEMNNNNNNNGQSNNES